MSKEKRATNFNLNLFLLVPILFSIHNFEEAYTMANWVQKSPELFRPKVMVSQFTIAVTILSIIGTFVTVFAKYFGGGKYFVNIMCGFTAILFMNAFFPHILAAFYFRSYVPGVLTAISLYLPFCSLIFYQVLEKNMIKNKHFILSFIIGTISGVFLAQSALFIGRQF